MDFKKRVLMALIPIVTLGILSWLPFLLLKQNKLTQLFSFLAGVQVVMLIFIPEGEGPFQTMGGVLTIANIVGAVVMTLVVTSKEENLPAGNPFSRK